jgi:threonine dehydrogenase-like Zn-dependent dehydrogenase
MNATIATLTAPYALTFVEEELAMERPHADEVAARTDWTVISPGTELAAYQGAPQLRVGAGYPRVVGYCNAATVTAVGAGVTGVQPGDRIVTFASHRSHFILPAEKVIATIPDALDSRRACSTYLFHLGYNALLKAKVAPGANVAVIGLGPLGLGAVTMARVAGAEVMAVSGQEGLRRLATGYGASAVVGRAGAEGPAAGFEAGIDIVILTTNSWDDWMLALRLARPGGVISVLGFPGRTEGAPPFNPLPSELFYYKQLTVVAAGFSPQVDVAPKDIRFTEKRNMAYLLRLMAEGRIDPEPMIGPDRPSEELEAAYQDLLGAERPAVTYRLRWGR